MTLVPLLLLAMQQSPFAAVHGRVVDDESGRPLVGVAVAQEDGPARAFTDSLGRYVLPALPAGPSRIRFSDLGYEPARAKVLLRDGRSVRLDVALHVRAVALRALLVSGLRGSGESEVGGRRVDTGEPGLRRYGADAIEADPFSAQSDALAVTRSSGDADAGLEAMNGLRVRGGSSDQNLVLLDGAPLYAPYHGGPTLGAIDPDAVASTTLHAGVPAASLGGALSSVVELRSRAIPRRVESDLGFGVYSTHALVAGPVGRGGFMFATQRSVRDVFAAAEGETTTHSGAVDGLAKAELPVLGGRLEAFVYQSRDALGFDAVADTLDGGESRRIERPNPAVGPTGPLGGSTPRNHFRWASGTQAVSWRTEAPRLDLTLWHAGLESDFDWLYQGVSDLALHSEAGEVGGRATLRRSLAGGAAVAGVEVRRASTRYSVAAGAGAAASVDSASAGLLAVSGRRTITSLFASEELEPGRWRISVGARTTLAEARLHVAPRAWVRFAATPTLSVGAGYARTYQLAQSLGNEESPIRTVTGVPLPVLGGRIPVARGDQLTGALDATLGPGLSVGADVYVRRLDGLVLVPPATAQPFALAGYATGSGRVAGATLRARGRWDRLDVGASCGVVASRRYAANAYPPSIPARTALIAMALRARKTTAVRAAIQAVGGRRGSTILGGYVWTPDDPLDDVTQIAGSPQARLGGLNAERLPAYLRVDLGVRQVWSLAIGGRTTRLRATLTAQNLLDRRNLAATSVFQDSGAQRELTLLPRSLAFSLSLLR